MERKIMGRPFTVSMFLRVEQLQGSKGVKTEVHLHGGAYHESLPKPPRGGRFGKLVVPQGFLLLVMPAYEKLARLVPRGNPSRASRKWPASRSKRTASSLIRGNLRPILPACLRPSDYPMNARFLAVDGFSPRPRRGGHPARRAGRRAAGAAAPAGPDWVVSRSNQFRVTGGDSLLRGTVALLAEETKDELLNLTGEKDDWKVPVTIRLHGKPGDPLPARTVSMRLLVVEGVSELRLDVHLSRGIEQERFKRAVTAALLYERALKKRAGRRCRTGRCLCRRGSADGLREATAWRLNQSDRRLYEALFKRGGLFKIDDLFAVSDSRFEDMDAAMRAAFRVSSGALVMALLEQPQGKEGFRAFLTEVAAYEGEMPGLLRKHFPELNLSETSLAKWWALQLANKGGSTC